MTNRKRIWIPAIIGFILIAGAAVWYGYHEFSRKTKSAETLKPEWEITADTLVGQFATDEARYTALYTGKVLEVTGTVKIVEGLPAGPVTVVLSGAESNGFVRMVLDSTMLAKATQMLPGSSATIRGICIGYTPDDMGLGADILFNRSAIIKN